MIGFCFFFGWSTRSRVCILLGIEPLNYYSKQLHKELYFTSGVSARSDWFGYIRDLENWRGKGRVWFLFSHVLRSEGVDEEQLFTQYLDTMGHRVDEYRQQGASVYLYDLK